MELVSLSISKVGLKKKMNDEINIVTFHEYHFMYAIKRPTNKMELKNNVLPLGPEVIDEPPTITLPIALVF